MFKILVPLDFSDNSTNALLYAVKLFENADVEFTILHTFESTEMAGQLKSMDRYIKEDAQKDIDAISKKVKEFLPEVKLKSHIVSGSPVYTITNIANSKGYDFIVMGTKGASGLKEVFIGSVAGGVISRAKIPAIIVPGSFKYNSMNEIIFAVSARTLSHPEELEALKKITSVSSATVKVLHLADDESSDISGILGHLEDVNPTVVYSFGEGNINERINEYMDENKPDLLCMVRYKKSFIHRMLGDSVTLKQAFHSPIPILILQNL